MRGLVILTMLAACADYDPPVRGDHAAPKYVADLSACQDSASEAADRWAKAHGDRFLTYPVSFPIEQRRAITRCMEDKGYVAED